MIDPGELNRRLVLEAPVESADGAGGVTRSYATVDHAVGGGARRLRRAATSSPPRPARP